MKREQIQEKFKRAVEQARRATTGERHTAVATLKRMIERNPWLRDYARLLGLSLAPGLTREFPWLAPAAKASAAKTRHAEPPGRASYRAAISEQRPKSRKSCATEVWVKPSTTPAGYEYKQCHKPTCHCMKGGAWHGPYFYRKVRRGAIVTSEYVGRNQGVVDDTKLATKETLTERRTFLNNNLVVK
jgi:hypothetical protein